MIRKTISIILSTILFFTTISFAGCNNADKETNGEPSNEKLVMDLNGIKFKYVSTAYLGFYGNEDNQLIADQTKARIADVEERLNIDFNLIINTDDYNIGKQVITNAAVGEKYADMTNFSVNVLTGNTDYFMPIEDVPGINLKSDKWQFSESLKTSSINGKTYGVIPMYWPGYFPAFFSALLYNRDLISLFNQPDPHEFYENKTWNWSNFEKMVTSCVLKEDSKNIYGINGRPDFMAAMAVLNNNGNVLKEEANGKLVFALDDPNSTEALQWVIDFFKTNRKTAINPKEMSDWDGDINPFCQGESTFLLYPSWAGTNQLEGWPAMTLNNYGWMPFPTGPKGTPGQHYCAINVVSIVAVPITTGDPEITGIVMNELFDYLDGYNADNLYDSIKNNLFFNETNFEIYYNMVKNAKYCYFRQLMKIHGGDAFGDVASKTMQGNKTLSEYFGSMKEKYLIEIDAYNATLGIND